MKQYIVIIDNVAAEQQEVIINKIKSFGAWARISETVWYVRTNSSITNVGDAAYPVANDTCKVFVVEVTSAPWASYNLSKEVTDWLKNEP